IKVGPRCPKRIALVVLLFLAFQSSLSAQAIQREWVRNYSSPPAKTNQATAIKVTADGNIIVAGTSFNADGNADYLAIKYSPAGDVLWTVRYDSPGGGNDVFRAMAFDPAGNLFLTGATDTVKVSPVGSVVWGAPLSGRA